MNAHIRLGYFAARMHLQSTHAGYYVHHQHFSRHEYWFVPIIGLIWAHHWWLSRQSSIMSWFCWESMHIRCLTNWMRLEHDESFKNYDQQVASDRATACPTQIGWPPVTIPMSDLWCLWISPVFCVPSVYGVLGTWFILQGQLMKYQYFEGSIWEWVSVANHVSRCPPLLK